MLTGSWRGPALVAAAVAVVYLAVDPQTDDLPAHVFRAELVGREGLAIWNGHWYAGHHALSYSVVFPPLAWLLGPTLVGALAAVAAGALFEPLVRAHFGDRAIWGALWFAAGTGSLLFTNRLPFCLGVAVGIGALLALQRGRTAPAAALAVTCSLASPVAGLFLALAGIAHAAARRWGGGDAFGGSLLAGAALAPPLLLSAALPEGGHMPFVTSAFLPVVLFVALCLLAIPPSERALRIGALLYGLGAFAAYAIDTPMGGNATRLGSLLGGPVLACVLLGRNLGRWSRAAIAAALLPLAFWQWSPALHAYDDAHDDPSIEASYFAPLLDFLERQRIDGRVEVVLTWGKWEAARVAPRFPLARGWERQLDTRHNSLFYEDGRPTHSEYGTWLRENAVRFVAVPDVRLDPSAEGEADLVRSEPPYLRPRFTSDHWRVYEVVPAPPLVSASRGAEISLSRLGSDEVGLRVRKPGEALVRVRWTPYWHVRGGCVERAGDWTRVAAPEAGTLRLTVRFSPERLVSRGRRCG